MGAGRRPMRDLHRPFWTATDGRRSGLIQVLERSQWRMTLFDFKNDIIASTVKRGQDWFSSEPSFPGNIYLLRHFSLVLMSTPPPFLRLGEEYKSLREKDFSKVFSYISRFSLKSYLLTTIKEIIVNGNGQPRQGQGLGEGAGSTVECNQDPSIPSP